MTHYAVVMKSKAFRRGDYIMHHLREKQAFYPQLCILIPHKSMEQVSWVEAAGLSWTRMNSDNKRDVRTVFVFSYSTCGMGDLIQMFKDTGWDVHNHVLEADVNAEFRGMLEQP